MQTLYDAAARAEGVPISSTEYSLHQVSLEADCSSFLGDWKSFLRQSRSNRPFHNPEWLRAQFAADMDSLTVYLLYRSGCVCGIAPFAKRQWPLRWQVGEITMVELPMKRQFVVGGMPDFPDEEIAWDLLFRELSSSTDVFDCVYLDGIPVESFLWRYLKSSAFVRRSFRRYLPQPPALHDLLHLAGSFETYLGRFSSKHRKNLLREVRRVKEGVLGQMQFNRYTKPEDVPEFVELASAISQKTWQWNLLRRGMRDPEARCQVLADLASHGWLRSYVLVCGETPVAYVVGLQYGTRFIFDEFGFDPDYSKYSVGTVLFVLMLEDLFVHQKAEVVDLGGHAKYKESFTKENYLEGSVFLFRPGAYRRFAQAGHQICQLGSSAASAILARTKWKDKLRKKIREWSLQS